MNKTFLDIINNVGTEVQDTSSAFQTILKTYINKRYFQVLRAINWEKIRRDYTISTVASTQEYLLPDDFSKAVNVRDTTNGNDLSETDYGKICQDFPNEVTTNGTIARYYITEDACMAQPTSASVIAVKSSSASDITQTITIRGIVGGYETYEAVTLTGTTSANSTNSYTRIKGISKSAVTVGNITLTSNSAAVTIAVLPPKITTAYYKKIGFHYVPNGVVTVAVPYYIKAMSLVDDYDYPIIDIADLIESGAMADAWRYKRQFAKAGAFDVIFASQLAEFIWGEENKPNRVTQFAPKTYNMDKLY